GFVFVALEESLTRVVLLEKDDLRTRHQLACIDGQPKHVLQPRDFAIDGGVGDVLLAFGDRDCALACRRHGASWDGGHFRLSLDDIAIDHRAIDLRHFSLARVRGVARTAPHRRRVHWLSRSCRNSARALAMSRALRSGSLSLRIESRSVMALCLDEMGPPAHRDGPRW